MTQRPETTFTIKGDLVGYLWWPLNARGCKPVSFKFARRSRPFVYEAGSLREAAEAATQEGGDFSSAPKLVEDSVLLLERRTGRRLVQRWFPIIIFHSIADYIDKPQEGA